jgi:hypothetical protein
MNALSARLWVSSGTVLFMSILATSSGASAQEGDEERAPEDVREAGTPGPTNPEDALPCGQSSPLRACSSTRTTTDLSFELDRDGTVYLARSDRTLFDYGSGTTIRFRLRPARPDDALPFVVVERVVPESRDGQARVDLLARGLAEDDLVYEVPANPGDAAVLRVRTFSGHDASPDHLVDLVPAAMRHELEAFRTQICGERLPPLRRRLGPSNSTVVDLTELCADPLTDCHAVPDNTVALAAATPDETNDPVTEPDRDVELAAEAILVTLRYTHQLLACPGDARFGTPLGVSEVPLTNGRIALVHWGAGSQSLTVRANEVVEVMLADVPRTTGVYLGSVVQQQDRATPLELVAQFARVVLGGVTAVAALDGGRWLGLPLPDASIPTVNSLTSRTYVAPGGDGENRSLLFCTAVGCRGEAERNRITLIPTAGSGLTLMLGATWMMPYDVTRGEDAYGYDRYVPVGGPFGPDQLFEVRNSFDARQYFVVSLLLSWRFADVIQDRDAFFGVGPTLVDLDGGRAFRDVHAAVGFETFDFVYLTFGLSVGAVERRLTEDYPQMLTVPRAMPGTEPAAPTPPRDTSAIVAFGIGLTVDLGVTGAAVDEVVDALD